MQKPMFDVHGKTVLITGGSSGIGRMMAEGFLRAGATVWINARQSGPLEAVCEELSALGTVHAVQADLGTEAGVATLVEAVTTKAQKLDVLINNAGIAQAAPFDEYPDSAWPQLMTLNVQVPFMLSQRLMPLLQAAATPESPARIINIGSVAGLTTSTSRTFAYAPSKAAVHQLTRSLARELALRNILVNCIAPGFFPTNMTADYLNGDERKQRVLKGIPLGRVGREIDIAGLALFLSSPASTYMTGNIIPLDGGSNLL